MLSFLLDEQLSDVVMEQVRLKRPEVRIECVLRWRDGALQAKRDEEILRAAWEDRLTLVTYDQRTIGPLLIEWAAKGRDHSGVVFIDRRTISQADRGNQVRGLLALWDEKHSLDWTNVAEYLKPAPPYSHN